MNISEIIKGGSLGHGTAVPNNFDLDLVVYSRGETLVILVFVYMLFHYSTDIDPASVIRNGVGETLRKFDSYLAAKYGRNYSRNKMTPFALQFTLYGQLEVDLLPSPHWDTYRGYLSYIAGLIPDNRRK